LDRSRNRSAITRRPCAVFGRAPIGCVTSAPEITIEGIASALGTFVGALPLTTYAQNIGVIATTGVASRRVIQAAAGLLIIYGLSPKCGALLLLIPRPIVGAVFMTICGMIATAGLKLLAFGSRERSAGVDDGVYAYCCADNPSRRPAGRGLVLRHCRRRPRLFLSNKRGDRKPASASALNASLRALMAAPGLTGGTSRPRVQKAGPLNS